MMLHKTVETSYRLELSKEDLLQLLNGHNHSELSMLNGLVIPKSADVTIKVPGGGDYSSTTLDLDSCGGLVISWETKEA